MGLAADVLARPRPERVVERLLIGIDEEVDRLGLGDAEQRRRLLDPLLADLERALAEGSEPLYQWTRTIEPATVFQSNRVSA